MKKDLSVAAVISFIVLGYVALALAFELVPQITALDIPANTSSIVETTLTVARWLIPTAGVLGILLAAIMWFRGRAE